MESCSLLSSFSVTFRATSFRVCVCVCVCVMFVCVVAFVQDDFVANAIEAKCREDLEKALQE